MDRDLERSCETVMDLCGVLTANQILFFQNGDGVPTDSLKLTHYQ